METRRYEVVYRCGMDIRAFHVYESKNLIAEVYNEQDARLLVGAPLLQAACKEAKGMIANAVEFINDGTDNPPNTPQKHISSLYTYLSTALENVGTKP